MEKQNEYVINVYHMNGNVFSYVVKSAKSAREHSDAIIKGGYIHNDGNGEFEHFPPHEIKKVKITGAPIPTKYTDEVIGT